MLVCRKHKGMWSLKYWSEKREQSSGLFWLRNVSWSGDRWSSLSWFTCVQCSCQRFFICWAEWKTGRKHDWPHRWVSCDGQVSPDWRGIYCSIYLFLFFCSHCEWVSWLQISVHSGSVLWRARQWTLCFVTVHHNPLGLNQLNHWAIFRHGWTTVLTNIRVWQILPDMQKHFQILRYTSKHLRDLQTQWSTPRHTSTLRWTQEYQ